VNERDDESLSALDLAGRKDRRLMSSPYNIALFLHVSGDIGIFIGITTWLFCLVALRRATNVTQVQTLTGLISLSRPVAIISALLTIATGLYMVVTVWGGQAGWAIVALVGIIVLLPPLVGVIIEPRIHAIVALAQASPDGPLPTSLMRQIHDPVLGTAVQTMAAIVLGIVFLMTTKPAIAGSIGVMAVALVVGLASGLPLVRAAGAGRSYAGSAATEE
jgi:hypothetical protein